jgi:ribosomal protein L6P/L9E
MRTEILTGSFFCSNFLGEKYVRRLTAQAGVEVFPSPNVKDELQLSGNSLEAVSQSAADIQQICRVRNKDIRKVSCKHTYSSTGMQDANTVSSSWTVCTCRSGATLSRSKE